MYQENIDGSFKKGKFTSSQVKDLIKAGFFVKIVQKLPKKLKGMDVQNFSLLENQPFLFFCKKTNIQKRSVIIFTHFLGWINENKGSKIFGLDLLDEYTFPQPMPEDKFYDYHIETDQAYLMLATEGTGI